jgi:hypothetical protein
LLFLLSLHISTLYCSGGGKAAIIRLLVQQRASP